MNKTVKHCGVCQENFGDRFSFCPVCGESLKAVEVGQNEAFAAAPTRDRAQIGSEEVAAATAPVISENPAQFVRQPAVESANGASKFQDSQPKKITEKASDAEQQPVIKSVLPRSNNQRVVVGDGMYHLTMLQTPPTYRRYMSYGATLGLFLLMISGVALFISGIYSYNLDLESPEAGEFLSSISINEDPPVPIEKVIPVKNKDEGGGGGGGGRQEIKPASKGADAPQRPEPPMITPSVHLDRVDNPTIKIQATTQGPVVTKRTDDQPYGIPNGGTDPSDGPGRGLGQGNGNGTGQGNGIGTGIGNGIGSGRGNGKGTGIGDGTGTGTGEAPPVPKAVPAVTERLAILAKPRANYTEEARKNQISGTVRVRVTFSASGQVTGITALGGLPYGLTDQAIAAARQIKFTPEKVNGVPRSVNKVIEYNFNLY
ncbi:MAG: energy transducer TonB [Pyrinomonadaceae bacterium]